jgi:hypothetical protein
VYRTGKRKAKQQLFERVNKVAAAIRNEMEMHQNVGLSMEQRPAAHIRAEGGHIEKFIQL